MNILYVITKANFGGAQKYVLDLATAAHNTGFDVAVAFGEHGLLADKLAQTTIRTLAVPELGRDVRLGNDIRAFFALQKICAKERPDVVHLNSSKAGVVGALAARTTGVRRIIFTAHGWAFNENRPGWQKLIFKCLQWFCVLLSHQTICVSETIRRDAVWMPFVQKKFAVIHNGVAEPPFITRGEARMFLQKNAEIPESLWIGTVAELHSNKRLDTLIDAFASIAEMYPEIALVIMGDGQERKNLEERIAKYRLNNHVHLLGHVDDAANYLKALDIFVLPSYTEALSLSILEAGLASLPVVASNVGGIPEIIDNGVNGLLFPSGNHEMLAAKLKELLDSPEKRLQLGSALREKVSREFSLERMMEKTLRIYES